VAVAIKGFTLVIPYSSIELGFPGGLLAWVEGRVASIGSTIWFDDKLTATSYYDSEHAAEAQQEWINLGFTSQLIGKDINSELLCAQVDERLGLRFSGCNWLEFDWYDFNPDVSCVWIKGTERGRVAVPDRRNNSL